MNLIASNNDVVPFPDARRAAHHFGEPVSVAITDRDDRASQTERTCSVCKLTKITVHGRDGRHWREWRLFGAVAQFEASETPPCGAVA